MKVRKKIDRFLVRSGTSASRFGRTVAGDPRLVFDIRKGRQPRAALMARLNSYLKGGVR
ncbi:MAG: hypothetical protein ACKVOJ_11580 [Sphingomonadaceae bacterium]